MPLTLRPPRKGKSPNYEIRGTYLGLAVERSAGTPDKKLALKVLNRVKSEIEEGKIKGGDGTTFLMAVKAYLEAGGEGKFMRPIIELDGEHSLCNLLLTSTRRCSIWPPPLFIGTPRRKPAIANSTRQYRRC